ncbi:unnamed protein product [Fusarium graminearum]|nr:unnamed protein product [Fusarium graminearum]VTO82878.1 unnamed protein product [Fusarium graminearum]
MPSAVTGQKLLKCAAAPGVCLAAKDLLLQNTELAAGSAKAPRWPSQQGEGTSYPHRNSTGNMRQPDKTPPGIHSTIFVKC